jgi:hypothetical protein
MVTLEIAWDIGTNACKFNSTFQSDVVWALAVADVLTIVLDPLSYNK